MQQRENPMAQSNFKSSSKNIMKQIETDMMYKRKVPENTPINIKSAIKNKLATLPNLEE